MGRSTPHWVLWALFWGGLGGLVVVFYRLQRRRGSDRGHQRHGVDGPVQVRVQAALGYDVSIAEVKPLLKQAAEEAGLPETFAPTRELLGHAVGYRAAGFPPEMKNLLSARSNLRNRIVEVLRGAGIEIVSPGFMNQRPLAPHSRVVAAENPRTKTPGEAPRDIIFDKAGEAASLEELKAGRESPRQRCELLKAHEGDDHIGELARLEARAEAVENLIAAHEPP